MLEEPCGNLAVHDLWEWHKTRRSVTAFFTSCFRRLPLSIQSSTAKVTLRDMCWRERGAGIGRQSSLPRGHVQHS